MLTPKATNRPSPSSSTVTTQSASKYKTSPSNKRSTQMNKRSTRAVSHSLIKPQIGPNIRAKVL